jgi:ABC-2 type transport system permease protein
VKFSGINKYLRFGYNIIQEYFVYRANFVFWRLRTFVSFLTFYFLWIALAQAKGSLGSYSEPQLYTYFLIGYILRSLVFSTRTADLGGQIAGGGLSRYLLRPISVIKMYFSIDLVDKLFNLLFVLTEFGLLIFFFKPPLFMPVLSDLIYFSLFCVVATATFFFYSLLVSFLSFWTDHPWSSRWLFGIIFINLFSGQAIPLDLLPPSVFNFLKFTPFPYLYYYPMQIWLGKISFPQLVPLFLQALLILFVALFASQKLWRKGLLKFQSYGD